MGYIEKNLNIDERIIYRTGLHWTVLLGPVVCGIASVLVGVLIWTNGIAGDVASIATVPICFGVLIIVIAVVSRNCTEMAVTNKRVFVKVGLIRHRTIELFLPKVESIGVERGLGGRMLGYGSIVVRGTGGTNEPFRRVRSPLEFRRHVQQQSESSTYASRGNDSV